MIRPSSRRASAIVMAAGLTLQACVGAAGVTPSSEPGSTTAMTFPAPSTTPPTSQPRSAYGGTIVVAIGGATTPVSLNPFIEGPDSIALDLLAPALFARGFRTDRETGRRVPDVLTGVPSLEAGTLTDLGGGTQEVVFEVVGAARWADGALITGADLEFTYQIASDPDLPIRSDVAATYAAVIPGSTTAEGQRLTLRMHAGTDPTDLFSIILPRHDVETSDFAVDWTDRLWVAGGPFQITDWQPGQFIEMSRNERYWKVTRAEGAPLPFLDRVIVRFFEGGEDLDPRLVDGFEQHDLDVVAFGGAQDRIADLEAAQAAGAVVETAPAGTWEHLNFQFGPANRNPESANASRAFRRAVAAVIDRAALAQARGTDVVDSVLSRFVPGLGTSPFAFDVDADLVASYVADGAPPITLTAADDDARSVALGGAIVTMLRDAGFPAELQLEDAAVLFGSTLNDGSWDVAVWRFGSRHGLGAAIDFAHLFDPDGLPVVGANYFRWGTLDSTVQDAGTRRYADIIDQLDRAVGPAAIETLLVEAEQVLADETVIIPLIVSDETGVAFWPASVDGVEINAMEGPFWNVDVWRVPTE